MKRSFDFEFIWFSFIVIIRSFIDIVILVASHIQTIQIQKIQKEFNKSRYVFKMSLNENEYLNEGKGKANIIY